MNVCQRQARVSINWGGFSRIRRKGLDNKLMERRGTTRSREESTLKTYVLSSLMALFVFRSFFIYVFSLLIAFIWWMMCVCVCGGSRSRWAYEDGDCGADNSSGSSSRGLVWNTRGGLLSSCRSIITGVVWGEEPGGQNGRSCAHSERTWMAWHPCACGSGASARPNGQIAIDIPPMSTGTVSRLFKNKE